MPDLEERFRSLGRVRTPDLWSDIEERTPRIVPSEPHGSRALAAAVAVAVAVAGIGVAVRVFTGREPLRLGRDEPGAIAFVVRDGSRATAPTAIFKVASDGTARMQLTPDGPFVGSPAWSPDGHLIAYSSAEGISVMDAEGANASLLVADGSDPTWSPGGVRIAFTCGDAICVARSDGSDATRLTDPRPAQDSAPAWSPDGGWIAFTRSHLDPDQEDVTHLFVMRPDGTGVVDLASVLGYTEAAWSPDASRIAFFGRANQNERSWEIFVMNSDGSDLTQLTRDEATDSAPAWSPDGAQIAFARVAGDGDADIYVMNADGSGMTRVTSDPADETDPAWQPVSAPSVTEDVTPDPSETPVSEPARISARVTDTIAISDFPNAIVAGEGGVWVSAPDRSGSGDIVRIDPTTSEVIARIPMEGLPQWEVGGGGMAVGLGSVWVTGTTGGGPSCCSVVVQQIDPGTNQVVDVVSAGPGFDSDIWVDDSGIWVLKFRRDWEGMEVVRFDATSHEVVASSRVAVTWSQTIFRAGPWVWILGTALAAEGPVQPNTLYRIDPITADVVETLELKGSVWQPAVGSDVVWVRVRDGVQRVDLVTGTIVGEPNPPAPGCCTYPFVSDAAGGVWVASSRDSGGDPALRHVTTAGVTDAFASIDPRDEEAWGGVAYAFEPTTQTIWVVHYRDAVSRIELGPAS